MVTVVGLGFVGLTTALGFCEYGHKVYGIESNKERMNTIKSGELPFWEPEMEQILLHHLGESFIPTEDWKSAVADSEFIYYCVGTPYGKDGQADLTYLYQALEQTLAVVKDKKFRVLVTKSTIPPSTTANRIVPFLEQKGIRVPEDMGVANNPEFLREGHCWEDFIHADRTVLGVGDTRSEEMLKKLYEKSSSPVCTVSFNTGEFIKYLSNTSLACLISFANEMSMAADAIGDIDIAEAFHILHMDNRWKNGNIRNYFYPGCGYGGYCLPKDTSAFYAISKQAGFDASILKNIIITNNGMSKVSANRILNAAGTDKNVCIGILGLSFNVGSDDVRDTPSAKIIQCLNEEGYKNILCYDPVAMQEFQMYYSLEYCLAGSCEEILQQSDVIAIVTAWPEFKVVKNVVNKPIIDCRYML